MKNRLRILLVLCIFLPLKFIAQSSGTGFLISNNGYIVTCNHVIEGATEISIKGINGDFSIIYSAIVIATDKLNDLAIIKVNCKLNNTLKYSINWNVCDVGQEVFTLGYPLKTTMGEEIKLTNGIISSKSGFQGDVTTYQITVPVQQGNSGGPLFDKNGYVIGVINAKHTGAENAGYSIKTNILRNLIQSTSNNIQLPKTNLLNGKSLTEQVKLVRKDILIIEVNSNSKNYTDSEKPLIVKTKMEAKIKSSPHANASIIAKIPNNTYIEVIDLENTYWKVFYKGKIGYCHNMYFEESYEVFIEKEAKEYSKIPPKYQNNNEMTIITSPAKFKNRPHANGDIIITIPKGEIIYIVGFENYYWKVYYHGREGYLFDGMYFDVTYEMMRFKKH